MEQQTIRLPAGISSLIEAQLELASKLRHEASEAEHLAVVAVQDYCVALGIPQDAGYQYDRAHRSVIVTPPTNEQQAHRNRSEASQEPT